MIGERIGHLRVIASIGVGGMGAVWHAVDELLDRPVALKVIRPELMSRPGLAERFRSEAIVLARLQHPCIAALYGLEKRGDEYVMVMEFVDGQTLDDRLAHEGALSWPEATRITRAVLDALDHAHESGVIHRDIKPSNVMITRTGRVKVMDFGIARLVGAERQTRTGVSVGTPSYMSPEQLLGQQVDGRSDVYAVGTLLYELATGHLPFEVEGDYLRMIAQLQEVPALPSTHNPALPSGLDLIVARALQKEPDDRYASSGDFRDALEDLEREHGVLRPYGTPAAGSARVFADPAPRTTGSTPAVSTKPVLGVEPNPAAVLTPADAAMSLTPVPFSVDPPAAMPIDLPAPVGAAADAGMPQGTGALLDLRPAAVPSVAMPTPEFTGAAPEPARRSAMPRALAAVSAITIVVAVGAMLSRKLTERENNAATPAPKPVAMAPAVMPPQIASPVVMDSIDSTAVKQAIADSLRAARKRRADSLRLTRDSVAAASASVFALPGSAGPSAAELADASRAARWAAAECVGALNAHEMPRLEALLGGDRKHVLRIAKDGGLNASGPLRTQIEAEAADRATARFEALLTWKSGKGQDRTATVGLRAIVERQGTTWSTRRCLVDSDGGARF